MQTLEELQQAYARNAAAEQQLADFDRRQRQAAHLRDTPIGNGIGAIGDVMSSIAGDRQYRQLERQRGPYTQQLAQSAAAIENEGLRRARAQEQRLIDSDAESKRRWDTSYEADEQYRQEMLALNRARLTAQQTGAAPGREPYKAHSPTQHQDVRNELNLINKIEDLQIGFNDNVAQISGAPTGFINRWLHKRSGDDVLKILASPLGSNIDADTKASLRWWGNYRKFIELGQQHELFGAQFTKSEQERWDQANLIRPGSDPKEVRAALNDMHRIYTKYAKRDMRSRLAGSRYADRDAYNEMVAQTGWALDENGLPIISESDESNEYLKPEKAVTIEMPEGLTPEQQKVWNGWSDEEKRVALGQ